MSVVVYKKVFVSYYCVREVCKLFFYKVYKCGHYMWQVLDDILPFLWRDSSSISSLQLVFEKISAK